MHLLLRPFMGWKRRAARMKPRTLTYCFAVGLLVSGLGLRCPGEKLQKVPAFSYEHCNTAKIYILEKGSIRRAGESFRVTVLVANGLPHAVFLQDIVLDLRILGVGIKDTALKRSPSIGVNAQFNSRAIQERLLHLRPAPQRTKQGAFPIISTATIDVPLSPRMADVSGVRLSDVEAGRNSLRLSGVFRWFSTGTQKWVEETATFNVFGIPANEK